MAELQGFVLGVVPAPPDSGAKLQPRMLLPPLASEPPGIVEGELGGEARGADTVEAQTSRATTPVCPRCTCGAAWCHCNTGCRVPSTCRTTSHASSSKNSCDSGDNSSICHSSRSDKPLGQPQRHSVLKETTNSWLEAQVAAKITTCLSTSDPELMRGMPLQMALHQFGHIFQAPSGSETTYSLSEPVSELDAFLSHNWSAPRTHKFGALALHYNGPMAVAAAFIACSVAAWLIAKGVFEHHEMGGMMEKYPRGIACTAMGNACFAITLTLGHELHYLGTSLWARVRCCTSWCPSWPMGLRARRVFLDKTCIHQSNEALKRRGIFSLGAFLVSSKKMVILYSHAYFKKIWTVYELACFLTVKSTDDCIFLNTHLPLVIAVGWVCELVFFAATTIFRTASVPFLDIKATILVRLLIMPFLCSGCFVVMRRWWREVETMQVNLRSFKLEEASCFDEKSRELLYSGIVAFMKFKGFANFGHTDRQALDKFEEHLRTTMSGKINRMLGRLSFSYMQALIIGLPQLFVMFDTLGAKLARKDPPVETVLVASYYLIMFPLTVPLALAVMSLSSKQTLQTQSRRAEACCVFFLTICLTSLSVAIDEIHTRLVIEAAETRAPFWFSIYAVFFLILATLTWLAYSDKSRKLPWLLFGCWQSCRCCRRRDGFPKQEAEDRVLDFDRTQLHSALPQPHKRTSTLLSGIVPYLFFLGGNNTGNFTPVQVYPVPE